MRLPILSIIFIVALTGGHMNLFCTGICKIVWHFNFIVLLLINITMIIVQLTVNNQFPLYFTYLCIQIYALSGGTQCKCQQGSFCSPFGPLHPGMNRSSNFHTCYVQGNKMYPLGSLLWKQWNKAMINAWDNSWYIKTGTKITELQVTISNTNLHKVLIAFL